MTTVAMTTVAMTTVTMTTVAMTTVAMTTVTMTTVTMTTLTALDAKFKDLNLCQVLVGQINEIDKLFGKLNSFFLLVMIVTIHEWCSFTYCLWCRVLSGLPFIWMSETSRVQAAFPNAFYSLPFI
ncbi:hypothetical protein KDK_61910 [Dictyobacter kobayashii]|uniref:Uncharacterized protein n=1 Tax=Dictyobacter kobayashii TaxID=2014872 RepID=A0A402ATH2_9CHLR|nr:hypothetical protein KDK_61910 [Dictyobacter kobayashii]